MQSLRALGQMTFSSLSVRNFRIYAIGQGISLSGTWMQTIAQGLLVLRLTGSGTALGLVVALQTLPVLLFGAWGGVVADRYPKRRILYVTQTISCLLALILGLLVAFDAVHIWTVYVIAFGLGMVNAIDNPTRQSFVLEMVGRSQLANAVSLNSTEINLARVIGPTIAGVLVATVGLAACFLINAVSYVAVIYSLSRMNTDELQPSPRLVASKGQLSAGLAYVRRTPLLLSTLIMMAIIGTFTYEFTVILPLFSEFTFGNTASGYAGLSACMGFGAVIGGLFTASRRKSGPNALFVAAALFGVSVLFVSITPTLILAMTGMVLVGFFSIAFSAIGNVTVQMNSAADMRGRIMALWTVAFLGSTPIGGPIIGAIGEHIGPRWGLAVGGFAAIGAAALGAWILKHENSRVSGDAGIPVAP